MKEKHTKRLKKMKGKTNWEKVKKMKEKDILTAAKSDPDALPLTKSQLKKFKRVAPVKEVDVKTTRVELHLTQQEFAQYFGVSVRTIQEWEQHRRKPTATARNFLKVIKQAPNVVQKVLASSKDK